MHISTQTLRRRTQQYGIVNEGDYTDDSILTDDVLDAEIQEIRLQQPDSGQGLVMGALRAKGYKVNIAFNFKFFS